MITAASDDTMKSAMKAMEEGVKKVKGEVKHHAKPQGKEDKFIEKMKVFNMSRYWKSSKSLCSKFCETLWCLYMHILLYSPVYNAQVLHVKSPYEKNLIAYL